MDSVPNNPPLLTKWNRRAAVVFIIVLVALELGVFGYGIFSPLGSRFVLEFVTAAACVPLFLIWLTTLISPGLKHRHRPGAQIACRLGLTAGLAIVGSAGVMAMASVNVLGIRTGGKLGIGLGPIRDLQHSAAVAAFAREPGRTDRSLPPKLWPASLSSFAVRPMFIFITPQPGQADIDLSFGRGARFNSIYVRKTKPDISEPVYSDAEVVRWADDVWLIRFYGD